MVRRFRPPRLAGSRPTGRSLVGRLVATAVVGALAAGGGAVLAPVAEATSTWPTYHADSARDGVDASERPLDPATKAWSTNLGAAVYGEPVVADGRIFAVTERNRVVALDPHSGAVLWSRSLGTPLTNVMAAAGCGDVDPLGITSTPAVDTRTNTVYVVGEVATGPSTIHHQLEAFNASTGALIVSEDVDPHLPAGEVPITLLQRASLLLANGRVYIGYGGNSGDCGNYHGWLVGVKETGRPDEVQFEVASQPGGQAGAIWEPGGPSVDSAGNVYVTTGNSTPFPSGIDPGRYAESVVKLSPTLSVEASFKDPKANADADLGTDPPTLISGGEVFAVGKTDIGYVLRRSNLSLVHAIPGICGSDPDGGDAYDAATNAMFVPCRDGGIQMVNLTTNTVGRLLPGENSGPILVGGSLWAAGYPTGSLSEYNATTGRVLQNFFVGSGVPTFASPSAALGLLLIGTTSGVTAFKGPGGLPPDPPAHRAGRASKANRPVKHS
jgi:outer membrane protein assembly factor BamB